ncbi:MAG: uroporphyrinogen-III C-methyltransferase, partial [Candidatus Eremiobacterota bacterium]
PCERSESGRTPRIGRVWLVGAGPGDPGLLTLRARRVLEQADAVVFDRLINPAVLRYASPEAELIFAGKKSGHHSLPQAEINALLVGLARDGKRVCRLKGGEPFLFGRGGEEAAALAEAGLPFEVIPGVSSTTAAPAYAGIPVTHRGVSSSFSVVTGHGHAPKAAPVAGPQSGTLVLVMCLERLEKLVASLLDTGRPQGMPVAVISRGTRAAQRVVVGTLGTIVARVRAARLPTPALTVVGEAVRLRGPLAWREKLPLHGRILSHLGGQAMDPQEQEACERLEEAGAEVRSVSAFRVRPLEVTLPDLSAVGWLVFTTPRSVGRVLQLLRESGRDVRALAGPALVALGEATARAMRARGLEPERVSHLEPVCLVPRLGGRTLLAGSDREPRVAGAERLTLYALEPTGSRCSGRCLVLNRDAAWFLRPRSEGITDDPMIHRALQRRRRRVTWLESVLEGGPPASDPHRTATWVAPPPRPPSSRAGLPDPPQRAPPSRAATSRSTASERVARASSRPWEVIRSCGSRGRPRSDCITFMRGPAGPGNRS